MKGLLIALGIAAGATTAYIVKKINDDRSEEEISSIDDCVVVRKETFKQAAKRKVNEILVWVAKNSDKVEGIVSAVGMVSTVLGVITTAVQLYSSAKSVFKDPNEELIREVDEIRMRLVYLTPDVEVELSDEAKKHMSESWTRDRRNKLSEKVSGKNNPMYGVHRFGELHPLYGKTGESSPRYGMFHSKESKLKISTS